MFLHRDFTKSGARHHSADKTCKGVPTSANVLTVNTTCGYGSNLSWVWLFRVIAHEQQHENGANKCLTEGSAARGALANMEHLKGTDALTVQREFDAVFDRFFKGRAFEQAMETGTSTPTSPVIWEWREHNAWTEQALWPVRHNGQDGC